MPSEARRIRDGADEGARSIGPRVVHAWGALDRDRRLAAVASALLFATMLLPWYQQNAVISAAKSQPLVSRNLNAFAVFSFVEAAVLLVAVAVAFLLFARAEGRSFHLPGGDGAVVLAAGLWTVLLLVWRLFDKPGITHNGVAANVGIQWGIFFALAAASLLAYAGSRMRAATRPEPPLVAREPRPRHREPERAPASERYPDEPPSQIHEDPTVLTPRRAPAERAPQVSERPRYPPPPSTAAGARASRRTGTAATGEAEQLSFEDTEPEPEPG